MELYRNQEYEQIAQDLVHTIPGLEYIKESPVSFVVLSSSEEKKSHGKIVFGECQKIDPKYKWYIPYDFQIVIYDVNIMDFDERQLRILIEHELRHIGINQDGNEPRYFVVPHDIEEFNAIIETYGIDWSDT